MISKNTYLSKGVKDGPLSAGGGRGGLGAHAGVVHGSVVRVGLCCRHCRLHGLHPLRPPSLAPLALVQRQQGIEGAQDSGRQRLLSPRILGQDGGSANPRLLLLALVGLVLTLRNRLLVTECELTSNQLSHLIINTYLEMHKVALNVAGRVPPSHAAVSPTETIL